MCVLLTQSFFTQHSLSAAVTLTLVLLTPTLQTRGADVEHGANREYELRLPVRRPVQLCGNQ